MSTPSINTERVYSADKKIWVGMKVAEANKTEEDMKLFNFADKDGDGEISKSELERYDGPLLVENFPEKKGRVIGHAGFRGLNALYIADNEVDYYPGLKIETVDKAGRVVYNQIDSDHNNVLSKKEMVKVTEAKEKIDKTSEKLHNIQDKRDFLTGLGICGGILGALVSALCSGDNALLLNNGLSAKKGWLFAGISLVTGVGLALLNVHTAKSKAQKEIDQLKNVTNNHPYLNSHIETLERMV